MYFTAVITVAMLVTSSTQAVLQRHELSAVVEHVTKAWHDKRAQAYRFETAAVDRVVASAGDLSNRLFAIQSVLQNATEMGSVLHAQKMRMAQDLHTEIAVMSAKLSEFDALCPSNRYSVGDVNMPEISQSNADGRRVSRHHGDMQASHNDLEMFVQNVMQSMSQKSASDIDYSHLVEAGTTLAGDDATVSLGDALEAVHRFAEMVEQERLDTLRGHMTKMHEAAEQLSHALAGTGAIRETSQLLTFLTDMADHSHLGQLHRDVTLLGQCLAPISCVD